MSRETFENVIKLYALGYSVKKIAQMLGLRNSYVRDLVTNRKKLATKYGIELPENMTQEDDNSIVVQIVGVDKMAWEKIKADCKKKFEASNEEIVMHYLIETYFEKKKLEEKVNHLEKMLRNVLQEEYKRLLRG